MITMTAMSVRIFYNSVSDVLACFVLFCFVLFCFVLPVSLSLAVAAYAVSVVREEWKVYRRKK